MMWLNWRKKYVTVCVKEVVAVGTVRFISDQHIVLTDVLMKDGRAEKMTIARGSGVMFWEYREGDEQDLAPVSEMARRLSFEASRRMMFFPPAENS